MSRAEEMFAALELVVVDEAYRWFWDEAPGDKAFSYAHIPGLVSPAFSSTQPMGVALDGKAPPGQGFAWASPTIGEGHTLSGSSPTLGAEQLLQAAARQDVSATLVDNALDHGGHTRGLVLLGPGLVSRAGAFVVLRNERFPEKILEQLGGVPTGRRLLDATLEVSPYVLISGDGLPEDGAVIASPVRYSLALDDAGCPIVGHEDAMLLTFLDDSFSNQAPSAAVSTLTNGQRSVMLAVLFALSCFNYSERPNGNSGVQTQEIGDDGHGSVRELRMGTLKKNLSVSSQGGLRVAMDVLR